MKKPSNSYTFGLIPFSKLFICGKWKWKQNSTKLNYTPVGLFVETSPTLHLSLYPCLLQCDSETPSVRKWSQFFHFYIWAGHGIFFLFALHIEWSENDVPSEELVQFSWTLLELYPRNVINPCGPSGGLEDVWIGACPPQPRAWYFSLQVAEPPSILKCSSRINRDSPGELQAGKDTQRSQQIAKQFTTT